jgi:hypothetical protein
MKRHTLVPIRAANLGRWHLAGSLQRCALMALAPFVALAAAAQPRAFYFPSAYQFPVSNPDTVLSSEVVAHFAKLFDGKRQAPSNDRLNRTMLLCQSPLNACPQLSDAEKRQLSGRWCFVPDPKDSLTTLLALRQLVVKGGAPQQARSIFLRLGKTYGTFIPKGDSLSVVPARWVSGRYSAVDKAHPYAEWWVADGLVTCDFRDGLFLGTHTFEAHGAYYREAVASFGQDASGDWLTANGGADAELKLFAHDVNRNCPKVPRTQEEFDVAFLLSVDAQGKMSLLPLFPKQFTDLQQIVVRDLLARADSLPAWSFGMYYLADGRVLPCRYLVGRYSTQRGWLFRDLLLCTLEKKAGFLIAR